MELLSKNKLNITKRKEKRHSKKVFTMFSNCDQTFGKNTFRIVFFFRFRHTKT